MAAPAAQVLVGKEQHLFPLLERPVENLRRIRRGAYDAAMFAAEGLQIGRGIDIGDRGDVLVRVEDGGQFAPGAFDLGQIRHVGHGTAGGQIGEDGNLFRAGHDVGHLGHEMHAAEDDEFGIGLRGQAGQLERISGQVGVLEHVGALVVMAQNHHPPAELGLGGADALVGILVGEGVEAVETDGGDLHGVASKVRRGRRRETRGGIKSGLRV